MVKMYLHTKNEVSISKGFKIYSLNKQKHRQTHRQTDTQTDRHPHTHTHTHTHRDTHTQTHTETHTHTDMTHPAGTSVSSVKYHKPVHSASHYEQWGSLFFWHVVRQTLWKIYEYHSHL